MSGLEGHGGDVDHGRDADGIVDLILPGSRLTMDWKRISLP